MKISYNRDIVQNPLHILRKAGYQPFTDPVTQKESFILRLTNGFYPRFHLYTKEEGSKIVFDLHLDQKKPSYAGTRMHGGEYDGPTVEKEMGRIDSWVKHETGVSADAAKQESDEREEHAEKIETPPPQTAAQKQNDLFGGIF